VHMLAEEKKEEAKTQKKADDGEEVCILNYT
jgi:hypothetical protein